MGWVSPSLSRLLFVVPSSSPLDGGDGGDGGPLLNSRAPPDLMVEREIPHHMNSESLPGLWSSEKSMAASRAPAGPHHMNSE